MLCTVLDILPDKINFQIRISLVDESYLYFRDLSKSLEVAPKFLGSSFHFMYLRDFPSPHVIIFEKRSLYFLCYLHSTSGRDIAEGV